MRKTTPNVTQKPKGIRFYSLLFLLLGFFLFTTGAYAQDTDMDGVPDITDFDDDNDGILDVVEGYNGCEFTTTANGFDILIMDAAYHATLIKTETDWIIAGQGLNGTGGDQLQFDYMSNIYTYPTGVSPVKVTMGGAGTVVVLMSNGEFYTAGRVTDTNIGTVLATASRPSGASWGLSTLTLPTGVSAGDIKFMRASGNMFLIVTYSGEAYVVGAKVNTELDSSFSTTSFNQINMPAGITVQEAQISQSSMLILGSDNNFYRYGAETFDGDGSGVSSITGTADLMTQPSLGGSLVQFEVGNHGSYLLLNSAGAIHVMGENSNGQLGVGSTTDQTTWTTISGVTGVKYISASRRSSHNSVTSNNSGYIGSDDKVYLFGHNNAHTLTNAAPNYGNQTTPVLASGVNADAIGLVMGGHITPYVNSSYDIMNTGHNEGGGFGDGTTTDRSTYSGTSIAGIVGDPSIVLGCVEKDTDGDLIPDYLDTDSDGDGCPDAIEGGGSFTNADIQNDTLTGGVDADGIPIVATASGQTIGDSQDAGTQSADCDNSCDATASGNLDSDNDNVSDICDLDSDNDGILDADEMNTPVGVDSDGDGIDDALDPDCDGMGANIPSANASAVISEVSTGNSGNAIGSDNARANMNAINDEMVLDLGLVVPSGTIIEIEAKTNTDGVGEPLTISESIDNITFINPINSNIALVEASYNYTLSADAQYIKLFRSTTTGVLLIDNVLYQAFSTISCNGVNGLDQPDTDGDSTPDYLDTDSDNDGCPDAIEGGGSFTTADIQNDTLTGGVDADGIPIVATASGQTVGDSQDAGTQDPDCAPASCDDNDMDGVCDNADLDDDNDGILDSDEGRCDQPTVANSNTGTGIYQDQLYFFNWDGTDFNDGLQTGDSQTFNLPDGLTITATFTNVTLTGTGAEITTADFQTWGGAYLKNLYNTPGNEETFYGNSSTQDMAVTVVFSATKNGLQFPLDLVSLDSESTNENTAEDWAVTTNGSNWQLLEQYSNGGVWTGAGTSTVTATDTEQSGGNSIFYSEGVTELNYNITSNGTQQQAFAIGIYLICDNDNDGIPNTLDTDSDGDGCPDAIEGGSSFTNTDIQNDTLTGGIDANGVPIVATASGQTIGDSQNAGIQDVDCATYCTEGDNDMDGVCDIDDLDDDNDGILDTDECATANPSGATVSPYANSLQIFSYPPTVTLNGNSTTSSLTLPQGTVTATVTHSGTAIESINTGSNRPAGVFLDIQNNPDDDGFRGVGSGGNYTLTYDFDTPVDIFFFDAEASADGESYSATTNGTAFEIIDSKDLGFATITGLGSQSITVAANNNNIPDAPVILFLSKQTTQIIFNVTQEVGGKTGMGVGAFSFLCIDSDGDGVPNDLDLDSDNDGCPDAIEGGGSFTNVNIQNDTLTGGVDGNGVPLVATASGQTTGDSQDAGTQDSDCSTYCSEGDNDNDGVCDNVDLDDDNDGILDTDEVQADNPNCPIGMYQVLTNHLHILDLATGNYTPIGVPQSVVYNALAFNENDGLMYATVNNNESGTDMNGTAIDEGDIISVDRNTGDITLVYDGPQDNGRNNSDIENGIYYSIKNGGANNVRTVRAYDIAAGTMTSFNLTGWRPADFSLVGGVMYGLRYDDPSAGDLTLYTVDVTAATPTIVKETITSPIAFGSGAFGASFMAEGTRMFHSNNAGGLYEVTDYTIGGNPFNIVLANTSAATSSNDGASCPNAPFMLDTDFDNDGIPNNFDTDSDGDGCPDALEGGATFTNADIQNDTLTGGVDADGIPIVATNTGQTVGTSQDSTILAAACITMAEDDINQTPQDVNVSGNILTNDTDPTGDTQTVASATGLDASGNPISIPVDGTPTPIYDENGVLAGTIAINPDGSYDFDPEPTFTGSVPVDYVVEDANGSTATASLDIDVIPTDDPAQNDAPVANDDTNTTEMDVTVGGNVIAPNDTDPDGDVLTVTSALADTDGDGMVDDPLVVGTPTPIYGTDCAGNIVVAGEMTLNANGTYSFDPEPTFKGEVPVDYTIEDPSGLSDDATLTITVEPDDGNDTFANDDANTGTQGDPQTGNVVTNDNDPEGNPQTVSGGTTADGTPIVPGTPVTLPSGGTLTLNPDGSYTYTPDPNFVGTEVVEYEVCDDQTPAACEIATLYLTTLPDPNTTVAENDINQTPQDVPVDGNILTNDTDPEGDAQTVQSATGLDAAGNPINIPVDGTPTAIYDANGVLAGTLALNPDGSYTFDPAPTFTGEVPVDYVVVDANGATDTATLAIEVMPSDDPAQNDAPVANDDTNTTEMDVTVGGDVIAPNDTDPDGDVLTVTTALADTDGDGMADDPMTVGTPTPIYGTDCDGNIVLAGSMTLNANGTYSFDPEPTFKGEVPVDYTIEDPSGLSDDATLTITVEPDNGNDTYANDDASTGNQGDPQTGNVVTNDNDPEGNPQAVTGGATADGTPIVPGTPVTLPSGGTLTLNSDGSYTYTPDPNFVGTEVVEYEVCDDQTPAACEMATLYLTTLPVNTIALTDDFNNTPYETPVSADVSTNDVDAEGDNQTFTLDGANGGMNPTDGSVTLNTDGSYTFTPANGFSGETEFQYSVCDDGTPALCDTATVYIEVLEPISVTNAQVIANPDANTVEEGQTGTGNVLSNDLDPDGLSPAVTTPLTNQTVAGVDEDGNPVANAGTLTLNTDGTYTFVPTPGFTGTVTQPYTICDPAIPAIDCDDTELIIDVLPNDGNSTFANDDAVMTDAGVAVDGDVSANDTDSENDTQAISSYMYDTDGDGAADAAGTVGTATQVGGTNDQGVYVANAGDLTLNSDGTYTFEPTAGFAGNVVVPYEICDDVTPTPACEEATLVITILDVKRDYGDAPVLYPAAWHRKMTDVNADDILDGTTDVWLGSKTSFEASQQNSLLADGDTNDDAITFGTALGDFPDEIVPGASYKVAIRVNSTGPDVVHYGLWIDWNKDGTYDNFYPGSQVTASPATDTVTIMAPGTFTSGDEVNIRLRADDEGLSSTDYEGGKSNGEVEDFQSKPILLPVELSSFKARTNGCDIDLTWVTETEKDFEYFALEWSGNGQDFRTVETIDAIGGDFTQFYHHKDRAASSFNYYRLKMVDLDGSYEYSNIVQASTECEDTHEVIIYPNPASPVNGILNVKFYSEREEAQLQITDMLGRVVKRLTLNVEPDFTNTVQIDISELPAGNYTLMILGDRTSKMFTIQK